MRRSALSFCALALLAAPRSRADSLSGTRSAEMFERTHTIDLKLDHGHATMVVRRTFENLGPKHDQAMLHIYDLPTGAVAVGLRTMGTTKDGHPIWYSGELLEAELAAARYKELTGIGGYYPKDPALLSWRSQTELALQVFPIDPKGGKKTVEYTLEAPTRWLDGHWVLDLPGMGTESMPASVTVASNDADDTITIDGAPAISGTLRRLQAGLSIEVVPAKVPKLGGRLASFSFAKNRALSHVSIEVSGKLSEAPKGAYVVVALDGSRSLDLSDWNAQVSATAAYLAQLPDAQVQIVAFDRYVRPIQDGFVPAAAALKTLRATKWAPKNGSAVDLAIEDAAERVSKAPAGAPRRLLVLSDLRTASSVGPSTVKGLEGKNALLHLATVRAGKPSLARDDSDDWARVPRKTGGLLWSASASDAPQAKEVFEEWVRPLRIDRFAIRGAGLPSDGLGEPGSLPEGAGFEDLRVSATAFPALTVEGELWSTPIKTTLATTAGEEKLWSAMVFGSDVLNQLKEPEMMTLAMKGGAVSPVTSYLAIEPGVRPSTEGLEEGEGIGMMGFGSGGGGFGHGYGLGKLSLKPDMRLAFLRAELAAAATSCGAPGHALRVVFETTKIEIAAATASLPGAKDETLRRCIEEKAWAIELPATFTDAWKKWDVSVGGT